MAKYVKHAGLLLSVIVLIVVVTVIVLVTFVTPSAFKPIITAQVLKYTGRELTIDGELSWTFFPYLGFKVGHMTLHNPVAFQNKVFAEINHATVGVKLFPILRADIETNQITLSGLTLHLIKNADGVTNWKDLQNLRESPRNMNQIASAQSTGKKMNVVIPSVDIEDSNIDWQDEQTHQTINVSHLELHAKDINQDHFFPVNASFDFATSTALKGQVKVQGDFNLELNKQMYAINKLLFSMNATAQGQPVAADIEGNVTADMAQQIVKIQQFKTRITHLKNIKSPFDISAEVVANLNDHRIMLNNITGQLANLELSGKANVEHYNETMQLAGHLQTKPFDLKKLLQAVGRDMPDLQDAKMLTANMDFSAAAPTMAALSMQGKISLDQLQLAKLTASQLLMDANLKNNVLDLSSITALFYQGKLQANAKIDFAQTVPPISLQAKLSGVQIQPLLQDLGHQHDKIKVKGAGDINLQITTAGLDSNAIVRNLNGTFNFDFKNGQLEGVNLGYLIDSAYALVKRQPSPSMGEDTTNFGQLSGTGVIQNGVITNKDLLLDSPRLASKGEGTIDLVSQRISYNLKTTTKEVGSNQDNKDLLNLYGLAIPVVISGDLSNPSIRVDAQAILQEVADQQVQKIQNKVSGKLTDQIKNNLPGKASDILQNFLSH